MNFFGRLLLLWLLGLTTIEAQESSSSGVFKRSWFEPALSIDRDAHCEQFLIDVRAQFRSYDPLEELAYSGDLASMHQIAPDAVGDAMDGTYDRTFVLDSRRLYLREGPTPGCGGACEGRYVAVSATPFASANRAPDDSASVQSQSLSLLADADGGLYAVDHSDDRVALSKLTSEPKWVTTCEVRIAPEDTDYVGDAHLRASRDAIERLKGIVQRIQGGEGSCGSLHTLSRLNSSLSEAFDTALVRPWMLNTVYYRNEFANLEQWALTGIDQYEMLAQLRSELLATRPLLSQLYVERFGVEEGVSGEAADRALAAAVGAGFLFSSGYSSPNASLRAAILEHRPIEDVQAQPLEEERADQYPQDFDTLLSVAIKYPQALRYLLSKGVDPDASNAFGKTALMHALQHNQIEAARILLEYNANIDAVTRQPEDNCFYQLTRTHVTALDYALRYGSIESIKLLIGHGAAVLDPRHFIDWLHVYTDGDAPQNPNLDRSQVAAITALVERAARDSATQAQDLTRAAEESYRRGNVRTAYKQLKKARLLGAADARTYSDLSLIAAKAGYIGEAAEAARFLMADERDQRIASEGWFNMGLICQSHTEGFAYDGQYYCRETPLYLFLRAHALNPSSAARKKILEIFDSSDLSICVQPNDRTPVRKYYSVTAGGMEAGSKHGWTRIYVLHDPTDRIEPSAITWKVTLHDLNSSRDITVVPKILESFAIDALSITVMDAERSVPHVGNAPDCSIFPSP